VTGEPACGAAAVRPCLDGSREREARSVVSAEGGASTANDRKGAESPPAAKLRLFFHFSRPCQFHHACSRAIRLLGKGERDRLGVPPDATPGQPPYDQNDLP
jgi:hypothetical protein